LQRESTKLRIYDNSGDYSSSFDNLIKNIMNILNPANSFLLKYLPCSLGGILPVGKNQILNLLHRLFFLEHQLNVFINFL